MTEVTSHFIHSLLYPHEADMAKELNLTNLPEWDDMEFDPNQFFNEPYNMSYEQIWNISLLEDLAQFNSNHAFRSLIHWIDLYGIPVISLVGIVGNMMCLLVFLATYLKNMSSSIYLAALSVCDAVFLLVTMFAWLDDVGIDIYHRPGWCQVLTYLGSVTSFLDVWYVVSFTVERYLAVCFPLKRQGMCTPKRAKIVVLSLAVLGCVLFSFVLWTSEVGHHLGRPFCSPKEKYFKLVGALSNVDTLLTLIIPTIIIITSNIRIGYTVARFYRTRHSLDGPVTLFDVVRTSNDGTLYSNSSYNRLQMKVTKMLLLVSSIFLFCHMPSHGFRLYSFVMSQINEKYVPSYVMILMQKLSKYIFIINFGSNFFLYNFSGKAFRRAMMRLLKLVHRRVSIFLRSKYSKIRNRTKSRSTKNDNGLRMVVQVRATQCIHSLNGNASCKICAQFS